MIDFITHEEDIADILRVPFSSVISDATYPAQGLPHPRVYGTFPRLLETYVCRRGVLTLPQAVRKITRLPADRLGLSKMAASSQAPTRTWCLFDPAAIHERGTWQNPEQTATGMDYVFVAGRPRHRRGTFYRGEERDHSLKQRFFPPQSLFA